MVRRDEQIPCMPAGFNPNQRRHSVAAPMPTFANTRPTMVHKRSMVQLPSNDIYMMRPMSTAVYYQDSSDMDTSSPLTTPSLSQDSDDSYNNQMRPTMPVAQRQAEYRMEIAAANQHHQNVACYSQIQEEQTSASKRLSSRGAHARTWSPTKSANVITSSNSKARGAWARQSNSVASTLSPPSPSHPLPCADSLWHSAILPVTERYVRRPSASKALKKSGSFEALYATRADAPWLLVPSAINEADDNMSEMSSVSASSSHAYSNHGQVRYVSGSPNSRQSTPSL
jgi:hypothetical protein